MNVIKAKGLGFIGDPHIWSKTPGRRLDVCFFQTVLESLRECLTICAQNQLIPVILGDLLEDENESDWLIFNGLLRLFKASPLPVWTVVGNHEKKQSVLTDNTMMAGLREAGGILCIEGSKPAFMLEQQGRRFLVGGTAYGQEFPQTVVPWLEEYECETALWVSHHDLAFDGVYPAPSVKTIEAIDGVSMLVNGHMHKTMPAKRVGSMVAFNPGNITPLSIDAKDHKPALWRWEPALGQHIEPHYIRFEQDWLDLAGTLVGAAKEDDKSIEAQGILWNSRFAALLQERTAQDARKTDDAVFLKEELLGLFEVHKVSSGVRQHVLDLLSESLAKSK